MPGVVDYVVLAASGSRIALIVSLKLRQKMLFHQNNHVVSKNAQNGQVSAGKIWI